MIAAIILYTLTGAAKGFADSLQFHFARMKVPARWNPAESWRNKYKDRDPAKGPAFVGATTFLVWLTDPWHLTNSVGMFFTRLGFVLIATAMPVTAFHAILFFVGLYIAHAAGFHLIYLTRLIKRP